MTSAAWQTSFTPDRCVFEHSLFSKLGDVSFRPAKSDRTPVLVMPLGNSTAALPLPSLQSELKIEDASPDGQMFALVSKALDFVGELRPGDPLPMEVLCGDASWQPDPIHLDIARARLRLHLVAAFTPAMADAGIAAMDGARVLAAAAAPEMALHVRAATTKAAAQLGIEDVRAFAALMEDTAQELSFLEALRERLLGRVQTLFGRVDALNQTKASHPSGMEMLGRVRRLTAIALHKLRARFNEVDELSAPTLGLLAELDRRRDPLHAHRDWLYCSLRAWEDTLSDWANVEPDWHDDTWPLLGRTYKFLAPRFMPMQEWLSTSRRRPKERTNRMVW